MRVGCRFELDLPNPSHALVLVEPYGSEVERVRSQSFVVDPDVPAPIWVDQVGNRLRQLLPAGRVAISSDAVLTVDDSHTAVWVFQGRTASILATTNAASGAWWLLAAATPPTPPW